MPSAARSAVDWLTTPPAAFSAAAAAVVPPARGVIRVDVPAVMTAIIAVDTGFACTEACAAGALAKTPAIAAAPSPATASSPAPPLAFAQDGSRPSIVCLRL
jgi:hypothetical protein